MRPRLALINPPYDKEKNLFFSIPYLLDGLRTRNPDIKIRSFDCAALGLSLEDLYQELKYFKPNIFGISIPFTTTLNVAIDIINHCKKNYPEAWIVSGGVHPTLCPEDLVHHCDYTVLGDGEAPLTKILQNFPKHSHNVPSTACWLNNKMLLNPSACNELQMGSPDWDGMDLTPFLFPITFESETKGITVFTSKGCPFTCSYCSNHLLWDRKIVYRDLNSVFDEIEGLMKNYDIKHFQIGDDLFTMNKKRVYQFCDMIEERGLDIRWSFQTRANITKDRDMFARMKEVGAICANIGVESGNEEILKFNKSITIEQIRSAVAILKEAGLIVYAGFIIGFPEDTIETVWDTIKIADELDLDSPGFQLMVPYPKTKVREKALREGGILTHDFSRYSTYRVVYVPPALGEYDMLAIRQFAFQYFHSRTKKRVNNFINRYNGKPEFELIKEKYLNLYLNKEKLNKDYLLSLKLKPGQSQGTSFENLPI